MQAESRVRLVKAIGFAVSAVVALAACTPGAATPRLVEITAPPTTALSSTGDATPAAIRLPPVNAQFDYQLGGPYPPEPSVQIVDRDRSERSVSGVYSICYVNAFQSQPDAKSFWLGQHRDLLVTKSGRVVTDPDWPGEYILDTSTPAKRTALATIVGSWIDGCATAGYQAVEPDNLDAWTRSKGQLTRENNIAFAKMLVVRAHAVGLAVAQKNTSELGRLGRTEIGFDFAVAEECQLYRECDVYTKVYGGHVIEIEYTDNPRSAYTQACAARGSKISVILRDRNVLPEGAPGYHYESC